MIKFESSECKGSCFLDYALSSVLWHFRSKASGVRMFECPFHGGALASGFRVIAFMRV